MPRRLRDVVLVAVPLALLVASTLTLQRAKEHVESVSLPVFVTPTLFLELLRHPTSAAAIAVTVAGGALGVAKRTHVWPLVATLTGAAVILEHLLRVWTTPPSGIMDMRVTLSLGGAYAVQCVMALGLVAHALAALRVWRRGDAPASPAT